MKHITLLMMVMQITISSFSQSFNVITVPYRAHDPNIPHPTYNGNKTILKAIARSNNVSDEFYYRWDADGDGTWDPLGGETPVAGDNWYRASGYNLGGWFVYPELPEEGPDKKLYVATLQVCTSLSGTDPVDPVYQTYYVIYYSGFPSVENIDQANDEQLNIMGAVAHENALWYLHKMMTRSGSGTVGITGYIEGSDIHHRLGNTGLLAIALLNNYHMPAYPDGTYQVYTNDPPGDFYAKNNFYYNSDPYSEDLIRLLNYLLGNISQMSVDAASELDDSEPISGTNDLKGYYIYANTNSETAWHPFAVIALALSGMMQTEVQVGTAQEKSWEFVIQQIVDYIIFLQIKSGDETGGWCYNEVGSVTVSYLTGAWALALDMIEREWSQYGVCVNEIYKNNIVNALTRYHNSADGGALWSYGNSTGSLFEATAIILNTCRWLGWDSFMDGNPTLIGPSGHQITKGQAKAIYQDYFDYMTNNWTRNGGTVTFDPERALWEDGNYNPDLPAQNIWNFSMLFTAVSAIDRVTPAFSMFGTHNWANEFITSIVKNQYSASGDIIPEAGTSLVSYYSPYGGTTLGVNTLGIAVDIKELQAFPEASANEVMEGCSGGMNGIVAFYHDGSFCTDPNRQIAEYQWIFESTNGDEDEFNNIKYNGNPIPWSDIPMNTFLDDKWHTTIENNPPVYTYMHNGVYKAALRVLDNSPGAPNTDVAYITITVLESANEAPVVNSGGPYTITEGDDLLLEGEATDPNETCGDVVTTRWDLDNDGFYDDYSGASGTVPWSTIDALGLELNTANTISLQAVDEDALETTDNTTLTINIATGLENMEGDGKISIYPNPVNDNLIINLGTLKTTNEEVRIRIIDNNGRIITDCIITDIESEYIIDVSRLEKGVYFLEISSAGISRKLSIVKI